LNSTIYSLEAAKKAKSERELEAVKLRVTAGGGSGPTDENMEKRVTALEDALEKIDGKLDSLVERGHAIELRLETRLNPIEVRLASIDGKLDSKASAEKVGKIEGHIAELPSKWFVGATAIAVLFGASALISAVLVYLEKLRTLLGAP
jgi:hypothetical protein